MIKEAPLPTRGTSSCSLHNATYSLAPSIKDGSAQIGAEGFASSIMGSLQVSSSSPVPAPWTIAGRTQNPKLDFRALLDNREYIVQDKQ